MEQIKDIPAFPLAFQEQDASGMPRTEMYAHDGMTLRDYFIAHAPVEPQPWFQPVMPDDRPPRPIAVEEMTEEEAHHWAGVIEGYYRESDAPTERMRAYFDAKKNFHAVLRAWEEEYEKQRYIQWPAAWADEMLAAREK